MRGILSSAGYVPYHRLARDSIGAAHGGSAGKGTRSVASYDEDTTSMGVEAARAALRSRGADAPVIDQLWFSTTNPSYSDKTNATTIHAALRLDRDVPAFDDLQAGTDYLRTKTGLGRTVDRNLSTPLFENVVSQHESKREPDVSRTFVVPSRPDRLWLFGPDIPCSADPINRWA